MKRKKILLVDDEESLTSSIGLYLERMGGYEVRQVNQSQMVLSEARRFKPDLIVLDIIMPNVDGGEVAAILEADQILQDIPSVFLTAVVSREEEGNIEKIIGNYPYLAKPLDPRELMAYIEETLAG